MGISLQHLQLFSLILSALGAASGPDEAWRETIGGLNRIFGYSAVELIGEKNRHIPRRKGQGAPAAHRAARLFLVDRENAGMAERIRFVRPMTCSPADLHLARLLMAHLSATLASFRIKGRASPTTLKRQRLDQPVCRAATEAHFNWRARELNTLRRKGLTARECEVACWLTHGKKDAEIARELSCATRTASKHVEHLLAKTGAENRLGAIRVLKEWVGRR